MPHLTYRDQKVLKARRKADLLHMTTGMALQDNCICTGLTLNSAGDQILSAKVFDSMAGKHIDLTADTFVLACGEWVIKGCCSYG